MAADERTPLLSGPPLSKSGKPGSDFPQLNTGQWCALPRRYIIVSLLIWCQMCCCPIFSVTAPLMAAEFGWDKTFQGHLHSGFFYGFMSTQFLGGHFSDRLGSKWVLFVSFVAMGACVALTPAAATLAAVFLLSRILMGLAEGLQGPSIMSMVGSWVPLPERSLSLALIRSGMYSGSIVGFILAPMLVGSMGWQGVWYVFGGLILLWCICWSVMATSTPQESTTISRRELEYIEHSTGAADGQAGANSSSDIVPAAKDISVGAMLSNGPVWAIIFAHFAHDWAWYVAISWLPTYFAETHGLSHQRAALYSALPFLCQLPSTLAVGGLADVVVRRKMVSLITLRRASTCIGFLGTGFFHLLSQLAPTTTQVLICICLAFAFDGMQVAGYLVNAVDIAPRNAGSVKGLGDTAGCVAGIVSNVVTGMLAQQHGHFNHVMALIAAIQVIGCVLYLALASDEPQFLAEKSGVDECNGSESCAKTAGPVGTKVGVPGDAI